MCFSQTLSFNRLETINKGCNLSNWLEAFWLDDDSYPEQEIYDFQDLLGMKAAGMSVIRLNTNFERMIDESDPYDLEETHPGILYVDSVLNWADSLDLIVILVNQHGWDDLNDFTYPTIVPRIQALWDQLTARYVHIDSDKLIFEIMNEPPPLLSRGKTRQLMSSTLQVIRSYTLDHTVIVSGANYSGGDELTNTLPLADTNIIYTWHFYEPFYFTHQGASWTDISYPVGIPFPFLNEENFVRNMFARVYNWQQMNNVPVFLGEFGAIALADDESRCNWIGLIGNLIDQYDISWAYWDCKYSEGERFGFFENNEINSSSIELCYAESLRLFDAIPTYVSSYNSKREISIWPNPATTSISSELNLTGKMVEIYDIMGRQQMQIMANSRTVDISPLPSGIYTLIISENNSRKGFAKFVKQ